MGTAIIDSDDVRRDARQLDLTAFTAKYGESYLLIEQIAENKEVVGGFNTTVIRVPAPEEIAASEAKPAVDKWPLIYAVGSQEFNDATLITVGRTRTSNITLAQPGISKLHAYFSRDPLDGSVGIADAGSTNGTTLNGHALEAKKKVALNGGDVIVLGGCYRAHYLLPQNMFTHFNTETELPWG